MFSSAAARITRIEISERFAIRMDWMGVSITAAMDSEGLS
jgi:hypothetical protein